MSATENLIAATASGAADDPTEANLGELSIKGYNERYGVVKLPSSTRILVRPEKVDELHRIIGQADFMLETRPDRIVVKDNDGKERLIPFGKIWLDSPERREYLGIVFDPSTTRDAAFKGDGTYNMFGGFAVYPETRGEGDWDLLRSHILENVCQGNREHFAWFVTWLSDLFQNPADKKGSAVVVKGEKGVGKTKVFEWVRLGIGLRHGRIVYSKEQLLGRFNGHQADCIFLLAEEAMWAGDRSASGVLKHLITGHSIMVERKNVDTVEVENCMRIAFTSNEAWVIPFGGEDERRFFVLECGKSHQQDIPYFRAIDAQMNAGGLQAMVYDLLHWQPAEHNLSWDSLRTPPRTEEAERQAQQGLTALQRFFVEIVETGEVPWRGYGDAPVMIELEEEKSVWVHARLLRDYARAFVMRHARPDEALRVMDRFDETLYEAFNVKEYNTRLDAIGREAGKKGRTIMLPSIKELRKYSEDHAAWLQPAIRKLPEAEKDENSTPKPITTIVPNAEPALPPNVFLLESKRR